MGSDDAKLDELKRELKNAGWTEQADRTFLNAFDEVRLDLTEWNTGFVVVDTPTQHETWPRHIAHFAIHFFDHKWRD